MSRPQYVNIVLDVAYDVIPQREHARYRRMAKPIRLVQVAGGRVRVLRGGVWTTQLFNNAQRLASCLLLAAGDAQAIASACPGTATGAYYADMAAFMTEAAVVVVTDPRVTRLWPS